MSRSATAPQDLCQNPLLLDKASTESSKTQQLLSDLHPTIDDLRAQRERIATRRTAELMRAEQTDSLIGHIEGDLRPLQTQAAELMSARSRVEAQLGLHHRIQELEDVRSALVADGAVPGGRPAGGVPAGIVAKFNRTIERTLEQWHVHLHDVSYDQYSAELFVGDHARAGHGKGMRAVLHAAFTVSLADYCLRKGHHHPGFIVLDSPLVTYREPGHRESLERHTDDPDLPDSVIDHFYRNLLHRFVGQAIVVENGDPPDDVATQAHVYMFSRDTRDHRFGFFPVLPGPRGAGNRKADR